METVYQARKRESLTEYMNGIISRDVLESRLARIKMDHRNATRRDRHQAMTDLGVVRVRGTLGGTYYE